MVSAIYATAAIYRARDAGKPWWYGLLVLVPLAGIAFSIELGFRSSVRRHASNS